MQQDKQNENSKINSIRNNRIHIEDTNKRKTSKPHLKLV